MGFKIHKYSRGNDTDHFCHVDMLQMMILLSSSLLAVNYGVKLVVSAQKKVDLSCKTKVKNTISGLEVIYLQF